jgi:hypothetical protein
MTKAQYARKIKRASMDEGHRFKLLAQASIDPRLDPATVKLYGIILGLNGRGTGRKELYELFHRGKKPRKNANLHPSRSGLAYKRKKYPSESGIWRRVLLLEETKYHIKRSNKEYTYFWPPHKLPKLPFQDSEQHKPELTVHNGGKSEKSVQNSEQQKEEVNSKNAPEVAETVENSEKPFKKLNTISTICASLAKASSAPTVSLQDTSGYSLFFYFIKKVRNSVKTLRVLLCARFAFKGKNETESIGSIVKSKVFSCVSKLGRAPPPATGPEPINRNQNGGRGMDKSLTRQETTALEQLKTLAPNVYRQMISICYAMTGGKQIEQATSTALRAI